MREDWCDTKVTTGTRPVDAMLVDISKLFYLLVGLVHEVDHVASRVNHDVGFHRSCPVAGPIHPGQVEAEDQGQDDAKPKTDHDGEESRLVARLFPFEKQLRANDVSSAVRNKSLSFEIG